jgi:acetylornithine deacetylase/succinyl-diaminopimelate desuccinylase-like protein
MPEVVDVAYPLRDPDRVWETARGLDNLAPAGEAHTCTQTTFSPNVARGGTKVNVIPDRVEIDVDIRALPGIEPDEVDTMLRESLGDLADRVTLDAMSRRQAGAVSSFDTPLVDALSRVGSKLMRGSCVVPNLGTGGTDARFFRWRGRDFLG